MADIWATYNLFGMVLYEQSTGDIAVIVVIVKTQIHCKKLLRFHVCCCPKLSCSDRQGNKIFDFARIRTTPFFEPSYFTENYLQVKLQS